MAQRHAAPTHEPVTVFDAQRRGSMHGNWGGLVPRRPIQCKLIMTMNIRNRANAVPATHSRAIVRHRAANLPNP